MPVHALRESASFGLLDPEPGKNSSRNPGRILLGEDDEMLSRFLLRMLSAEGYEVELARDGSVVLGRMQEDFDLLLLDLNLPEIDGIGVLQQLRPRLPQLPVLVLTARAKSEGTLLALNSGADDCLTKPFSYAELLARIRSLLRRTSGPAQTATRCGDLVLHRERMSVQRGETPCSSSTN